MNDKLRFILDSVFHYVPAGRSYFYDIGGVREEYDYNEFWWRSCVTTENISQGEQGYLTVWWVGENLESYHSYRHPTNRL